MFVSTPEPESGVLSEVWAVLVFETTLFRVVVIVFGAGVDVGVAEETEVVFPLCKVTKSVTVVVIWTVEV